MGDKTRVLTGATQTGKCLRVGIYLIVGSHIQGDRQALVRLNAGQRRVEGQLAHGDAHATGAQVSQTQDPLPVGDHNSPDIWLRPELMMSEKRKFINKN